MYYGLDELAGDGIMDENLRSFLSMVKMPSSLPSGTKSIKVAFRKGNPFQTIAIYRRSKGPSHYGQ